MYALVRRSEPSNEIGKELEVDIARVMDNSLSFEHVPNMLGQGLKADILNGPFESTYICERKWMHLEHTLELRSSLQVNV